MQLLLNILYLYIVLYTIYFLVLAVRSVIKKKKNAPLGAFFNKLCVIIYSHNNEKTLSNLLNQMKQQDYPQTHFTTYVVLDNCQDNSEKLFVEDDFAKVFNIKDQGTIGKDQSISILLEKLNTIERCDAYVFIDAKRFVDKDFLTSVNEALQTSPVVSGPTKLVGEDLNLRQKLKSAFHKYRTNFILKSRAMLGLAMIIDSNMMAMKQDLMKKIGCIDFQNINSELKYSLLLSKIGCKCTFNPNVRTYINIDDFKLRIPSITTRLGLFKNCFAQIGFSNIVFDEQVFGLVAPNVLVLLLGYIYLLKYSFNYYFFVDFSVVLVSCCLLIIGFSLSLVNANLKSNEIGSLLLYPLYSFGHIVRNFPPVRAIRNNISRKRKLAKNTEKLVVNVTVTDGKRVIPCRLALISESGLAKVVFSFKKKRFSTKTHLRMVDAISELTSKLKDYGFILRVCQCCQYFEPNIDGSTNMVKGFCKRQFTQISQGNGIPTLLWNSCDGFCQNKSNDVIEEIFN